MFLKVVLFVHQGFKMYFFLF